MARAAGRGVRNGLEKLIEGTKIGSTLVGDRPRQLEAKAEAGAGDSLAPAGDCIGGEIRQGALEGVMIEGIAEAADIPSDTIRRAVMLASDPAPVAVTALTVGAGGLSRFRLAPLSPLKPMLAQPAEGVDAAMQALGEAALEFKLDGARVQIHRVEDEVRIFSRRLNDVTDSLPEGHEGIMAKSLDGVYAAGNRGAGWLKLKQAHTLDLVILAAEWGSGRRRGWLSNLHLGARSPVRERY